MCFYLLSSSTNCGTVSRTSAVSTKHIVLISCCCDYGYYYHLWTVWYGESPTPPGVPVSGPLFKNQNLSFGSWGRGSCGLFSGDWGFIISEGTDEQSHSLKVFALEVVAQQG